PLAVVQLEHGHIAARVHLPEVAAAFHAFVLGVDLLQLDGNAGLARDDVRRKRASSRCVVKLHALSPSFGWDWGFTTKPGPRRAADTPHACPRRLPAPRPQ